MDRAELEERTKRFALTVIRFVSGMPRTREADVLGRQLLRAATSIGANYREANRAESRADFIHKIALVEREAAETRYWLDLLLESRLARPEQCGKILDEATEILAIFTTIGRTAKRNNSRLPTRNSQFAIRNSK